MKLLFTNGTDTAEREAKKARRRAGNETQAHFIEIDVQSAR